MNSPDHARAVLRMRRGPRRDDATTVACPWCKARPGQPCRAVADDRPLPGPHPLRLDAAALAADDQVLLADTVDAAAVTHPQEPSVRVLPLCPECRTGKHHACAGDTWDDHLDEAVPCPCRDDAHDYLVEDDTAEKSGGRR